MIKLLLGVDIFATAEALQGEPKRLAVSPEGDMAVPGAAAETPAEGVMFEMQTSREGIQVKAQARYLKGKWVMQTGSQGFRPTTRPLVGQEKAP